MRDDLVKRNIHELCREIERHGFWTAIEQFRKRAKREKITDQERSAIEAAVVRKQVVPDE